MIQNHSIPSRLWFMSRGFKQVPPELIDGKILWAHPDGFFVNSKGQKVKHEFNRAMQKNEGGSKYPKMRYYGNKLCHHLMYVTFYGARTAGMEIDHINGDKLDYRPSNLELVDPEENERRSRYLRVMRECDFDPRIFTADDFHHWFSLPFEEFKALFYHQKTTDHA